jgi:hypothetical protein
MKLSILLTLAGLAVSQTSHAAVTVALTDLSGDPASAIVTPGSTFQIIVTLTSTAEQTAGFTYFLEAAGSANGKFTVISRSLTSSVFPDVLTEDSIAFSAANGLMGPVNDHDLGGLTASGTNGVGSFRVASLMIQALPGTPLGSYVLSTAHTEAIDGAFSSITVAPSTYSVNVVPEPGAAWLLMLALSSTACFYRRR